MNKLDKWFNKHITHNRDDEGDYGHRVMLHIPVGMLIGIPIIGIPMLQLFIRYEENEDKHVKDEAWKDYAGAMIGTAITSVIILVLILWRVLWI